MLFECKIKVDIVVSLDPYTCCNGRYKRSKMYISSKKVASSSDNKYYVTHVTLGGAAQKYEIVNNIQKIVTKFMTEGKLTIEFKEPKHIMFIQADKKHFPKFLNVLKMIMLKKPVQIEEIKTKDLRFDKICKSLSIQNKSDYPYLEGFSSNLTSLKIVGVDLTKVDRRIFDLKQLVELDLSDNNLKHIPKELGELTLRHLNLSKNQLSMGGIKSWCWTKGKIKDSLVSLIVSYNKLEYLPKELNKFSNLSDLNLSNNLLKTLHWHLLTLPSLRNLNLSYNKIIFLPAFSRHILLETLDMTDSLTKDGFKPPIQTINKIPSLLDIAGKLVIKSRLKYNENYLPEIIISYLNTYHVCVCGGIIFQSDKMKIKHTTVFNITKCLIGYSLIPLLYFFCSFSCSRFF